MRLGKYAEDVTLRHIVDDGECIRFTNGFATPVRDGAEIVILPALSGG